MATCDVHCHFFSSGFFGALGRELGVPTDAAVDLPRRLGWEPPGSNEALADRWSAELDANGVSRAMLIASTPGDEDAVATAVRRHPGHLVGAFMFHPGVEDADTRLARALGSPGLSTVCLFPAMHHVTLSDPRVEKVFETAARFGGAVFVHCGQLSVGVRAKLGLSSPFDLRLGDPLGVAALAVRHPTVPVIIPHFGAGLFREALMATKAAPNVYLDTSSSNGWIALYPGLTLRDVFDRALDVAGPARLVFGTDSSFFPRGWQRPVADTQRAVLEDLGVGVEDRQAIFSGNFARLFVETRRAEPKGSAPLKP